MKFSNSVEYYLKTRSVIKIFFKLKMDAVETWLHFLWIIFLFSNKKKTKFVGILS